HQRGRPYLQPRGKRRHVRIAQNDVETTKAFRVGVWLIPSIDDGPALHRIDALQFTEKIAALGDLEALRQEFVLGLHRELSRAGKNLTRDKKSLNPLRQRFPRQRPREQVILVATVTVTAEVRVVFVEADGHAALLGQVPRASHQNAFPGAVMRDQLIERATLDRKSVV